MRRLLVDGRPLQLDDPALTDGWAAPERDERGEQRWTTAAAALPAAGVITVELDGFSTYWRHQPCRTTPDADATGRPGTAATA